MNATEGSVAAESQESARTQSAPDAPQRDTALATESGSGFGLLLPLLFAAIVGGLVGAAASSYFMARQMKAELAMRPPIAVVDAVAWVKDSGHGDSPVARLRDGAKRLNATVATLRAKGVLVLDASSVRSAPTAVVVSTPNAPSPDTGNGGSDDATGGNQ